MTEDRCCSFRSLSLLLCSLLLLAATAPPLHAGEYVSLTGVKGLDAVFDVGLGSPLAAAIVFPAMREVYLNSEVRALPAPPRTVIVFRSKAVKLISSDRTGLDKDEIAAYDKVAELIRQFKKEGVKMEVCLYAVKTAGINPATILPEIDRVGNGFISILGYQNQGYALVALP